MGERFERFVEFKIAHIPEGFRDETRVEKMHASVFRTADVFVYGEHLVDYFGIERHFRILAVGISEIVPTRTHERVECIGISRRFAAAFRAGRIHKRLALRNRRLAVGLELNVFGQKNG